jgi:catechol 2,3-dioxygenase
MSANGVNPVLHHVNLKTTRLPEMIEWYRTVVGMRVQHVFPGGAWLANDAANHRVALLVTPAMRDDPDKIAHTGMHHMAFEYPSMDSLLDGYVRLRDAGITPHGCLDHGMTMSMYYVDPDGNSVELQCDEFGDWARSGEWMRTSPEFSANPIGEAFDPDLVVAARDAGAGADELHRRAYAGEFRPPGEIDLRLP